MKALLVVIWLLLGVLLIGFICPALISMPDWAPVAGGFLILFAYIYVCGWWVFRLAYTLNQEGN